MKPEAPRTIPGDFLDAQGSQQSAPGVVFRGSWGSPGAPCEVLGGYWEHCWLIFVSQVGVRGENSEKLEFDVPLNENTMLLRSQGLENEV